MIRRHTGTLLAACAALTLAPMETVAQSTGDTARVRLQAQTPRLGPGPLIIVDGVMLGAEPLVVIDGVVLGAGLSVRNLNVIDGLFDISSIEIIREPRATQLYGARAAAGVLFIRTRDGQADSAAEQQRRWSVLLDRLGTERPVTTDAPSTAPLIIVDGVVIGRSGTVDIDILRDRIESVEIIKGAAAAALYGARAASGVIIITTKKEG